MGVATVTPGTRVMTVTTRAVVTVETTVDLVAWYAAFSAKSRDAYWSVNLADFMEAPFQRPTSFVDHTVYDAAEDLFVPIAPPEGRTRVETEIRGYAALRERAGKPVYGVAARWTEDDYLDLLAAVPWLRPPLDDGLPPITMNVPFDGMGDVL